MDSNRQAMICYLATLGAIVGLALAAALICMVFDGTEAQLAKVIAALAFIGGAITGLIGVIGTFRPKGEGGNTQADANLATALDKMAPLTTGTGPAKPAEGNDDATALA